MSKRWKAVIAIAVVAPLTFAGNRVVDDGGFIPVISDEAPPLVDEWTQTDVGKPLELAAFIPAIGAVLLGYRSGEADYDKYEMFDPLTDDIPFEYHDNIMANDNFAAALRARRRQLARLASNATAQYFFDLFPDWWASHTACMTQQNKLEAIKQLTPELAWQIETTNAQFADLAMKEQVGTLTVAERDEYLNNDLRVPHLVRLPNSNSQIGGNWVEVDLRDPLPSYDYEGPLVRACPVGTQYYGQHIKDCFGYVNIDLGRDIYGGAPSGSSGLPRKFLGNAVYREFELTGSTVDFILQMMEQRTAQDALKRQAEQIVANRPASEVSAGFVESQVRAEFKKLQCPT